MRLHLFSCTPPSAEKLAELLAPGELEAAEAAIITTARNQEAPAAQIARREVVAKYFKDMGVSSRFVDLCQYETPEETERDLAKSKILYVTSGNVFSLRYGMRKSGFDSVARSLLETPGTVYLGERAGASVLGTSLAGFELTDDPHVVPQTIYAGLDIVHGRIVAHRNYHEYSAQLTHMESAYKTLPLPYVLHDNESITIIS